MVHMKVLLIGDARIIAGKISELGFKVTYDPGDPVVAAVSDAASCRFAPEDIPLVVLSTGSIADWPARQARPDAHFVPVEEAVKKLFEIIPPPSFPAEKKGKSGGVFVLSYANKGGAGKSTVAIGIALALSQGGVRTVLCDFDFGGADVAAFFNVKRAKGIEAVAEGEPPEKALINVSENLYILPGPQEPTSSELTKEDLDKTVSALKRSFAVVVGDTPQQPYKKPNLHGLFRTADRIYAVVDQSKFSVHETEQYAPTLLAVGVDPERIRIVVNRYNPKLTSIRELEESFCAGFKKGVHPSKLPRVAAVIPEGWEEHVRAGFKGRLPSTGEWAKLAREISSLAGADYKEQDDKKSERRGLFGWLKKK